MFYAKEHIIRMYSASSGGVSPEALLDFAVLDGKNKLYMASFIGTSSRTYAIEQALQRANSGSISVSGKVEPNERFSTTFRSLGKKAYDVDKMSIDDFVHYIVTSKLMKKDAKAYKEYRETSEALIKGGERPLPLPENLYDFVITLEDNLNNCIYETLFNNYTIPMLKEWTPYIVSQLKSRNLMEELNVVTFVEKRSIQAAILKANEYQLKEIIQEGIQTMQIMFANYEYDPNEENKLATVASTADYIRLFPVELAKAIQENVEVRFDAMKQLHQNAFKDTNRHANENGTTGLYPPQANAVMGAVNTLSDEKFAFIVGEMGCGKSAIGTTIPFIHSSKDVGENSEVTPFRAFVISPNIVVEKWGREISQRIPNAKVTIIRSLKDVIKLYNETSYINERGKRKFRKPEQVEYYIMSSELMKAKIPEVPEENMRYEKKEALAYLHKRVASATIDEKGRRHIKFLPKSAVDETPKYVALKYIQMMDEASAGTKIMVTSGKTGQYCKCCGKPIMKDKNIADETFFKTFNRKKKEFTYKKLKTTESCEAEILTSKISSNRIKYWRMQHSTEFGFSYYVPKHGYQKCDHQFWGPEVGLSQGMRKVSPAWFINKKFPRGFFKYLIADEVHELASGTSSRAQGFGQLVNHTEKQILLTGTLFGGMAKDIFYLLARVAPEKLAKEGLDFNKEGVFNSQYGVIEKVTEQNAEGESVGRPKTRKKPGINPHLFPMYLMKNAVFLELSDLYDALPKYEEVPVIVQMDEEHKHAYSVFSDAFIERCRNIPSLQGMKSLSSMFNLLYQYADAPYSFGQIKLYDEAGHLHDIFTPEKFEPDFTPAKLRALQENIDKELANGRKNLVYAKYTGDNAKTSMDTWLYDYFKSQGYNVGILRNKSYDRIKMPKSSTEREKWLKDMMEKHNWDILITNPGLVKVGLDLLDFPNIHFYQIGYSTFEFMQASRRSWRIGQTKDVKVFTYINAGTIQEEVLKHLARKIDASLAIQGKFSEEGLRAMSEATGGITDIAKELINGGALEEVETIYDIFKRKNQTLEDMRTKEFEEYPNYTMNPLGIERVREIANELRNTVVEASEKKVKENKRTKEYHQFVQQSMDDYFDNLEKLLKTVDTSEANKGVPKRKQVSEGQLELDLFAL